MKLPKASIIWPAASFPVWPWPKTTLVEATFKANLSTVAINNRLGKLEKSKGLKVCIATIKITKEIKMFETKKTSSKKTGRGNTIIATSIIMPSGKIPDLRMSEKLPVNDVLLLVSSMTLASPCQK